MGDTTDQTASQTETAPAQPLSDLDKIKAAHAARRSRRTQVKPQDASDNSVPPIDSKEDESDDDPRITQLKKDYESQISKLKEDTATLRMEIKSLNRLRTNELKDLTDQRDMFAMQLAKEQQKPSGTTTNTKTVDNLTVQLKAARIRNNDLEDENKKLRDEVKQLTFLVQANKTLSAASEGYEEIIQELVAQKLKCAQLTEEKEGLMHINSELTVTAQVLREANGELEKSRTEWVVKCADLEREKGDLYSQLKNKTEEKSTNPSEDTSYPGSDLQELKLN